jgi:hypothetical protein
MTHVDGTTILDASTILDTVGWLIDHLDDEGLREVRDLPMLELAKHVSVNRRAAA